jgi:hypothetical protein
VLDDTGMKQALLVLLVGCGAVMEIDDPMMKDLDQAFAEYTVVQVDVEAMTESLATSGHVTIGEQALELAATDLRAPSYRAEAFARAATFRGRVIGEEGSQVRMTMLPDGLAGYYTRGGARYFVEPAIAYSQWAPPGMLVVYRAEDALVEIVPSCAGELAAGEALVARAPRPESTATLRVLELATDADHDYVTALGGPVEANQRILHVLNMVEGVYESELGVSIDVVYQHAWTAPDPYGADSPLGVLQAFRAHWNASMAAVPRDFTQLFTGKAIAENQGLAYTSVVCRDAGASYGLTGPSVYASAWHRITAHELGHGFGAQHVAEPQGCASTIMNATISLATPLTFCATSRAQIASHVATAGSCLGSPMSERVRFDFDADGDADFAAFRPSTGEWHVLGTTAVQFGQDGDRIVAADYDGDGKTDPAVFRDGTWYRLRGAGGFDGVQWGVASDELTPADFDGDGRTDVAIFRPATGDWWVLGSTAGPQVMHFGQDGDRPVPGDFDGDGRADVAIFRPTTGEWWIQKSSAPEHYALSWGIVDDIPIAGDFDGDGRADATVFRPSDSTWYAILSADNAILIITFGEPGDIPVPADYDGDGKTDRAVFRPSNATWYMQGSAPDGGYTVTPFGLPGDVPAAAAD